MNARTHISLRDQIIAHLAAHGEATADEITRAIGMTNTPSKVTNELNAMRCDALVTTERKGKTGAHHYWLAVPGTPDNVQPTPKAARAVKPNNFRRGTRKAQVIDALNNGLQLTARQLCDALGVARGALDTVIDDLYKTGYIAREAQLGGPYKYFRGAAPQLQPAVSENTGSDGSGTTTPEAVAIPPKPQPDPVGHSRPAPAAGDASPTLLDVMHHQMAALRHRLEAVDAELTEAAEALVRVIGDDSNVDTSDLSLVELVGEVEHQIEQLRQATITTPTLPTYDAGTYQVRVGSLLVARPHDQIYSELTTTVRITDEAAGEFIEVEQVGRTDVGKISICRQEWPALRQAVDMMIAQCREAA